MSNEWSTSHKVNTLITHYSFNLFYIHGWYTGFAYGFTFILRFPFIGKLNGLLSCFCLHHVTQIMFSHDEILQLLVRVNNELLKVAKF